MPKIDGAVRDASAEVPAQYAREVKSYLEKEGAAVPAVLSQTGDAIGPAKRLENLREFASQATQEAANEASKAIDIQLAKANETIAKVAAKVAE